MQRYTDLKVWERSHLLVLEVYRRTEGFPEKERFGLTAQLRRAATSVPANIAEGSRREGSQDFARFLNIAEGSLAETGYLLLLSRDLAYLEGDIAEKLLREVDEIGRMLYALRTKVERRGASAPPPRTVD
jgi:four helix bundle protein